MPKTLVRSFSSLISQTGVSEVHFIAEFNFVSVLLVSRGQLELIEHFVFVRGRRHL